jgi:Arabinose efflux permease
MPVDTPIAIEPKPVVRRSSKMFRALSHRNYRVFWVGAFLSNCGTWMQAVAQGWLVLELTNSTFWLGLDAFMATAPGFVLTLIGGVFADLIDRRRLLIITQIIAGVSALSLAVLISTGLINRWVVLAFSFLTGSCMALASPSYLAMTYDLVGREDLANAIALNSTQFQLARVVGPTLAGFGFRLFGLAGCFYANGLSYIAVVSSLMMVRPIREQTIPVAPVGTGKRTVWHDLIDGLKYVRNRPRVSSLLLLSAVHSLFSAPYFAFVPYYARDVFRLGETGLAWMMGTSGLGAFFGALLVAYLGDFKRKGWLVLGGAFSASVCVTGFALSTNLRVSLVFLFFIGFSIVVSVATTNTLLQKLVTDQMRGRVMSMFMLSFMGTMPIGNIVAGLASKHFGTPHTLATGGLIVMTVVVIVTISNKRLRSLY